MKNDASLYFTDAFNQLTYVGDRVAYFAYGTNSIWDARIESFTAAGNPRIFYGGNKKAKAVMATQVVKVREQ